MYSKYLQLKQFNNFDLIFYKLQLINSENILYRYTIQWINSSLCTNKSNILCRIKWSYSTICVWNTKLQAADKLQKVINVYTIKLCKKKIKLSVTKKQTNKQTKQKKTNKQNPNNIHLIIFN